MRATGTMSEAFGPEFLHDDYRQRLWQHAAIAKAKYGELSGQDRAALIEAYQAGVKQYMKEHPSEVPAWAPEIEPWMCVALSRYIIWGWPEGEAGRRSEAASASSPIRSSITARTNGWSRPERTAYNAPIALIDPHLSWYGAFRFYEVRLYGGEIEFSGMCILGNAAAGDGAQPLLLDRHDHRRSRHLGRVRRGDQSRPIRGSIATTTSGST